MVFTKAASVPLIQKEKEFMGMKFSFKTRIQVWAMFTGSGWLLTLLALVLLFVFHAEVYRFAILYTLANVLHLIG